MVKHHLLAQCQCNHLPVPEPLEAAVVLSSAIVSTLAFILQVRCLTFSCSILR